jgi:endoglucanase
LGVTIGNSACWGELATFIGALSNVAAITFRGEKERQMPRNRLRSAYVLALAIIVCIALHCTSTVSYAGELQYTGVNLSGAEFGMSQLPGTYNSAYTYPTNSEVDYYTAKGMNTFRMPFRWERLQQTPNATLDTTELSHMDAFVNYATGKGDYVLIDPHNFERYYPLSSNFQQSSQGLIGGTVADTQSSYNSLNGTGSGANVVVTDSMFANFWGQIAAHYKNNDHVIFDLMNEPANVSASQVATTDNAAIAAIRNAGANQMILLEGSSFTGAWSWTNNNGTSGNNSTAFAPTNIVDPANNWAIEMHQYMDSDGSGTHSTVGGKINPNDAANDPNTAMIGADRLAAATQWLQQNHVRGFLGEFAVDNSIINKNNPADPNTIGNAVLNNLLQYMQANSSTWIGWTWWGGGPWWANNSLFHIDPVNGVDQNDMAVLQQYLPKAGDFNRDGHVDASDIASMEDALADINGWRAAESAQGLNTTQENIIADVNKDGVVNIADLQKLINLLLAGGGSDAAVPEPSTFALLGFAACSLPVLARRHNRCRTKNGQPTF